MYISEQTVGDVTILKLEGRLDAVAMPTADSHVRHLIATHAVQLILDLSDLSYIASAGNRGAHWPQLDGCRSQCLC